MKLLQSFKILQNLSADLGPVLALFSINQPNYHKWDENLKQLDILFGLLYHYYTSKCTTEF